MSAFVSLRLESRRAAAHAGGIALQPRRRSQRRAVRLADSAPGRAWPPARASFLLRPKGGRCYRAAALTALVASLVLGCRSARGSDTLWWRMPGAEVSGAGAAADTASRSEAALAGGALACGGKVVWSAHVEAAMPDSSRIQLVSMDAAGVAAATATASGAAPARIASWAGTAPGLAVLRDGTLVLAYREVGGGDEAPILARRGSADGRAWSAPVRVSGRSGWHALANGRLAQTSRGDLLVPAVWRPAADSAAAAEIVCYRSRDAGKTWKEAGALRASGAADPAVAEVGRARLLMVLRLGTRLARSQSADRGATWSAPVDIGIEALPTPHALARTAESGRVALAWVDPPPDSTMARPTTQALRLALSSDAGRTWVRARPLYLHPGRVPAAPALALTPSGPVALVEEREGGVVGLLCVGYDAARFESAAPPAGTRRAADRYSTDTADAAEALRVLTAHTLGRSAGAQRLFVEAYYMRSLVAAHEALESLPHPRPDWLDPGAPLERAVVFADTLLRRQNLRGYWPTGYLDQFWADMGAAVALFPALEPHVDSTRVERYVQASERFLRALDRDHMLLGTGAVGLGWPFRIEDERRSAPIYKPYLVSTALVGIETQAWLYRRTRRPEYRERALAALDYTLSRLRADGSLSDSVSTEKPLRIAAYVQEGWMAADILLGDPEVLSRLRRALPAHVRWLLHRQNADGTWNTGDPSEYSRTPPILDFLIWYDQRCERSEEVRRAIRRGSAVFLDPERWPDCGLYRRGAHYEVLRALWGRSLAALVRGKYVL